MFKTLCKKIFRQSQVNRYEAAWVALKTVAAVTRDPKLLDNMIMIEMEYNIGFFGLLSELEETKLTRSNLNPTFKLDLSEVIKQLEEVKNGS